MRRNVTLPTVPANIPQPPELLRHAERFIIGQSAGLKRLVMALYKHILDASLPTSKFEHQVVLLMGPPGCGKTASAGIVARKLGCPMSESDAKQLSEVGYVGCNPDSVVKALLTAAGGNLQKAERGVCLINEIDKIRATEGRFRDVSGRGVQQALLSIVEGTEIPVHSSGAKAVLKTNRIGFVFTGAFVELEAIIRQRLLREDPGRLGSDATSVMSHCAAEDLVEYGFLPELVGRFSSIIAYTPLSAESMLHILTSAEDSPLSQRKAFFRHHGCELTVSAAALHNIAVRASRLGLGARGLRRILKEELADIEWRLFGHERIRRYELTTVSTKE